MIGLWKCLVNVSEGFVELGHFDKHFLKNTKKGPAGNYPWVFSAYTLKSILWMQNLTQRWTQSGPVIPKSRHFFWLSKRAGEPPLPPPCPFSLPLSCAPVSVAEYASISLNMPKYPWKCLNKLFYARAWICLIIWHVCQAFEDASGSK